MNTLWLDRCGSLASAACATHCFLFAVLPSIVSAMGMEFLSHEAIEWSLFTLAIGLALTTAVNGYRSLRAPWLLGGFGLGAAVLLAGRLGEAFELYGGGAGLAIAGGLVLAVSHLASLRELQSQRSTCCE